MRMARGKADRALIGKAQKGTNPFSTHILVYTEREVRGRYILDGEVVYVDEHTLIKESH